MLSIIVSTVDEVCSQGREGDQKKREVKLLALPFERRHGR
jgi:hypothetical protein